MYIIYVIMSYQFYMLFFFFFAISFVKHVYYQLQLLFSWFVVLQKQYKIKQIQYFIIKCVIFGQYTIILTAFLIFRNVCTLFVIVYIVKYGFLMRNMCDIIYQFFLRTYI